MARLLMAMQSIATTKDGKTRRANAAVLGTRQAPSVTKTAKALRPAPNPPPQRGGSDMDKERIRQLAVEFLSYNQETGIFHWKKGYGPKKAGDLAGCRKERGYWHIRIGGQLILAHQLAWLICNNEHITTGMDHINGDPGDNRIVNLRPCVGSQNNFNTKPRNKSSGEKGVTGKPGSWQARIRYKTKLHHLGTYKTIDEASAVYKLAAEKFFGEFAYHKRQEAIRTRFGLGE